MPCHHRYQLPALPMLVLMIGHQILLQVLLERQEASILMQPNDLDNTASMTSTISKVPLDNTASMTSTISKVPLRRKVPLRLRMHAACLSGVTALLPCMGPTN